MPLKIRTSIATFALISATTLACSRGEEQTVPPAQSQSTSTNQLNTPTTVVGCLRAGDAADTYVLTTTQTENGQTPATYQLAGTAGVNLADHVGDRVEITGIVTEQQSVATTESRTPTADQEKAEGTSGTPTVQTGTQVAMRRLEVKQVSDAGGKCEQK